MEESHAGEDENQHVENRDVCAESCGWSWQCPKCPPANDWAVRRGPAYRGVLLSHEKGMNYEPRPQCEVHDTN